jgi:hypothetical protein
VPWVWAGWERLHLRLHPVTRLGDGSLFGYRRKGHVLELHLDSRALNLMRGKPGYSTFRAVRGMRADLSALADRVRSGALGDMTELTGTSLMGEAGAVLGFDVRPLPRNLASVLQQYFMVGIDAIYHPRGLRSRAVRRWPVEVWMSVDELLKRY